LPSRVADNLFWLGRYASRAEEVARLLRAILVRLTDESGQEARPELAVLVGALRGLLEGTTPKPFVAAKDVTRAELEGYVADAIYGAEGRTSLRGILDALRQGAWTVRDRISVDAWRILNRIDHDLEPPDPPGEIRWSQILPVLNEMVVHLAAFSGMAMDSMTRAHGWRFLEMGRRLERAGATAGLLRCALTTIAEPEEPVLNAILEVADSSMTYRSRYMNLLQAVPVLDLLLVDESNPRSVAFQLVSLVDHVDHLPRDEQQSTRSREQRLALEIQARLRLVDVFAVARVARGGRRNKLDQFLKEVREGLLGISEAVTHAYFSHSRPARQLAQRHIERLTTYASPDSL
jgi:uncharacterized alpha-E superfamily protein